MVMLSPLEMVIVFPDALRTAANCVVPLLFGMHGIAAGLQDHMAAVVQSPEPVLQVAVEYGGGVYTPAVSRTSPEPATTVQL
jgi:hypothetical protein